MSFAAYNSYAAKTMDGYSIFFIREVFYMNSMKDEEFWERKDVNLQQL